MSMRQDSARPLYQQVADAIRDQIRDGSLSPGGIMPSEMALAQEHSVGRPTIRLAMQVLKMEGLVVNSRGMRSRVREAGARITLTLQPSEEVSARMPSPAEARRMDLAPGEPLLELRRDGQVEQYPAYSTILRGASPSDWTPPPLTPPSGQPPR